MAQYSVSRQTHKDPSNLDIHEIVMIADKDGNLINSFGAASNIPISSGNLDGYNHINKLAD